MTRIAAIAPVLPEFHYSQSVITGVVRDLLAPDSSRRALLERMHGSSRVEQRYTVLELERYREQRSLGETQAIWAREAEALGERAVRQALETAGIASDEVDLFLFTSVTGVSAPSIDAVLIEKLGMRSNVRRWPSFGLGCVAGATGLARVHDYLAANPRGVAVLLAVELCSLTLQLHDESVANFVASGLFGDGAAAVVLLGDDHPLATGPRIVATESALYPGTGTALGFNLGNGGFEIMLTAEVADIIEAKFPSGVSDFLAANGTGLAAIDSFIAHPGGPRILEAFAASLGLPDSALQRSWESLARQGNLSSVSVLHVLAETPPFEKGLLFALGPGVTAELILLEGAA
jgi:alkylresorcinol/alkylpyrone synthase